MHIWLFEQEPDSAEITLAFSFLISQHYRENRAGINTLNKFHFQQISLKTHPISREDRIMWYRSNIQYLQTQLNCVYRCVCICTTGIIGPGENINDHALSEPPQPYWVGSSLYFFLEDFRVQMLQNKVNADSITYSNLQKSRSAKLHLATVASPPRRHWAVPTRPDCQWIMKVLKPKHQYQYIANENDSSNSIFHILSFLSN